MNMFNKPNYMGAVGRLEEASTGNDVGLALETGYFLTPSQLARLPQPGWLLDRILPRGALTCLYGPSGAGKSFLSLDWTLTVATSRGNWLSHTSQAGKCFYIAGEGATSMKPRIDAWIQARGVSASKAENLLTHKESVDFLDIRAVAELADEVKKTEGEPAFIVIDTLARCFGGGDENSAKDMGAFIASTDLLRRDTGATLLVVHHTGKVSEKGARGSSALHAAADTMIELKASDEIITLTCTKQKDAAPFKAWRLKLTTFGESAVLNPVAGREGQGPLKPSERELLEQLDQPLYKHGAKKRELVDATELGDKVVQRALGTLSKRGYVRDNGESPQSTRRAFLITEGGRTVLTGDDLGEGWELAA